MADDKPTLTRRRVLGGLATIGVAGAVGAGTGAYWSDEESASFTATAGDFGLKIEGGNNPVTLQTSNVYPGDSGRERGTLKNVGSIEGYLDVLTAVTMDNGQLDDELEVRLRIGPASSSNGERIFSGTTVSNLQSEYDSDVPFSPGEEKDFVLDWAVPTSAGNAIQNDSVTVEFTFDLNQTKGQ